ncbi:RrF2 family transcriptional regulator [Anditalea andensis]|uniref:Rrf2 family transcriptional regulator n=1 Tax=Anditalea andensis TaxID=1048983 RepID=A0A074L7G4_9BACT|nr:Rrf2 family transcriptional regulator [Anditalea andensis]KEO75798.1 Rrf2 family transcriptional regulator [Anditalea andensis]
MFSKACEYGIRAVIFICSQTKHGKKMGVKDICKEIDAPEFFTAKVLQSLAKKNIISSSKGPTGGFFINSEQEKLKAIDLVIAIDGDKIFRGCALGLKQCSELNPCPIHNEFKDIRESLTHMLENKTIQELAAEVENGLATLARIA